MLAIDFAQFNRNPEEKASLAQAEATNFARPPRRMKLN